MSNACVIPICGRQSAADAPLPLCDRHFAAAGDWAGRTQGFEDVLPSPCLACGSRIGIRYSSAWLCSVCEWRLGDIPDAELAPPRVDVVYYPRHGELVKIGTTANPRRRFTEILHEEVLAFERGDRRLEHHRHEQFSTHRFAGTEWFRLAAPIVEHVDVIAGGRDPWDVHSRWVSAAAAANC